MKFPLPALDKPFTLRGTEIRPDDTPEQYRQKLARIMLDEVGELVGLLTRDGMVVDCNRGALAAAGVTREEATGKEFWGLFWWARGAKTQSELREAIGRAGRGELAHCEVDAQRNGGAERMVLDLTLQPVTDEDKRVLFVLAEGRDAADKKSREREAAQQHEDLARLDDLRTQVFTSEERLRLAQSAAQIGTWEWDPTGGESTLSPELHEIFGTAADDPHSREQWASRVHRADWAKVQQFMAEGDRTGQMEFDYRYYHPRDGLRWLYCKGRRAIGSSSRMLGIVQDITNRKLADEASHRLAAIVESSNDAIVSKDLNGIVTSWNRSAEKMFGFTAQEMVGSSITKIIPRELHDDENRILATIARGGRIEHFETVRVNKAGELIEVSLTISPVKDDSGRIIGAAKIVRDITQRNKTEQALRTTERLASVGRLAATVAHEINNPLEAVTNLVYLAREQAVQKEVRDYLARAEEELDRVSLLTKQTLGFYRETRGTSAVKLEGLIRPLITVFASRTRNKELEVDSEFRADPEIEAVPGEVRQLVANLLSNSIDAVDGGGRIRIRVSASTEKTGEHRPGVRITVADTGAGIPAPFRAKIFEPFFTTKKEIGTGLGLWVCKSIVDKHHGSIRLKSSTAPGKSGTSFSVFLPCSQPRATAEKNLLHAG
jgi:PAS domain S-box-containing protein